MSPNEPQAKASSPRVLITGAHGQLSSAIATVYVQTGTVRALGHQELDITDATAVEEAVALFRPTLIINCAAYNQVDRAEDEPLQAFRTNAYAVRLLAKASTICGATLVHYSTDFVFDGTADQPYIESDVPNPQSVYGASKLFGEWFAEEGGNTFILRVASLFGGNAGRTSVDRILEALTHQRQMQVITDRTASPSYIWDVADATRALIERGSPGLYHCVSTGCCTWHELSIEAAKMLGYGTDLLIPVPASDIKLRAVRPKFAALSNEKLSGIFQMPTWQDALKRHIVARQAGG
jgi:dTDP-4-dehydrorhamnose reductase